MEFPGSERRHGGTGTEWWCSSKQGTERVEKALKARQDVCLACFKAVTLPLFIVTRGLEGDSRTAGNIENAVAQVCEIIRRVCVLVTEGGRQRQAQSLQEVFWATFLD